MDAPMGDDNTSMDAVTFLMTSGAITFVVTKNATTAAVTFPAVSVCVCVVLFF